MLGVVEDVVHRPALHDPAQIHDDHVVGHLGDHAQVVGDEDDGQLLLLLQLAQQVEDLGLGGHIQGRGRLVGDQDVWGRWRAPWRSSPAGADRR